VIKMKDAHATAAQYTNQSLSVIHHALRASRRRLTISFVAHQALTTGQDTETGHTQLLNTEASMTVRQIAKQIVAIEEDTPVAQTTGDAYHNVYTALIQTHLPKLDDIEAIHYDADRKKVVPAENLIALAMVAAITSPVAQMLFHDAVADFCGNKPVNFQDSIGD
jgi:hypothetical protein